MLNVAIGIIFIYLLLSLISTAVNEIIENFLKARATNLERGIRELLQSKPGEGEADLTKLLYNHPLVNSLYKGQHATGKRNLPSYIPAANFASALVNLILTNNISSRAATPDMLPGAAGYRVAAVQDMPITVSALRSALITWPYSGTRQALISLAAGAGDNMGVVMKNIEAWFNSSMDRTSGWYKRHVQRILIVIGFVIAGALNADSIAIFKSLTNNPPLRNALVAASQEYAKAAPGDKDALSPQARVEGNIKQIDALQLPVGWMWKPDNNAVSNYALAIPTGHGVELFWNIVLKVLGLALTGLAISLGAPFWFDTLNKVMVIRSTVKPHEKSPEEKSDDRQ